MIKNLQYTLYLRLLKAMVQGGKAEQHQETEPVNTCANNAWYIGIFSCQCSKYGDTDDAKKNTESMYNTVYCFLLECKRCSPGG